MLKDHTPIDLNDPNAPPNYLRIQERARSAGQDTPRQVPNRETKRFMKFMSIAVF